jgi:hypothetical protein
MPDTRLRLDGRDLVVHSYQDVEDIIEHNKALQTEPQTGHFRHIASIPLNIINQWLQQEWDRGNVGLKLSGREFDSMVARKLRDPDWAYLRTDSRVNTFHVGWR